MSSRGPRETPRDGETEKGERGEDTEELMGKTRIRCDSRVRRSEAGDALGMEASACPSVPAQGPGPPGEVSWGGRDQPHPQGSGRPSSQVGERGSGGGEWTAGPTPASRVVEGRGVTG